MDKGSSPERNKALGVWGGLGGFGATAGLLLGGLITDTLGWQWGSAAPLLPFRLLRSRVLVGGNLLLLIAGMAVDGMLITLTSHVQQVLGWSAAQFGLAAAAMTVASVAGALFSQRMVTRLGIRQMAASGTVLLGAACLLLTRISADDSLGLLLVALLVFGAGMGTAAVCSQIAALTGVAERDSGLAAGLADTSFAIGTALGVAICSSIATASASASGGPVTLALTSGHRTAFATAAIFAATGLVLALTLLGKRPSRPDSRSPESCDTGRQPVSATP